MPVRRSGPVQVDQIWNNPRKLNGSVKRIKNIDTWTDNLQLKLYDLGCHQIVVNSIKNDQFLPGTESSGNVEPAPFNIQVIYSYSFYHDRSTYLYICVLAMLLGSWQFLSSINTYTDIYICKHFIYLCV